MESIKEGLRHIERKAARLSTLADELAIIGVDYVSDRTLAGCLREIGWTYKNTGKMRLWIAPGQDDMSAGVTLPANVRFRVGEVVTGIIEGRDSITVEELHRVVRAACGARVDTGIANRSMELRSKEWRFVKNKEGNYWERIAKSSTCDSL